jgi:hypothetical protein
MATNGPYLIDVPAFADSDLVYNEDECKQIFKFFYPDLSKKIDELKIDNIGKQYAQTLMVAAIDGSYYMAYIHATFNVYAGILQSGKNPGVWGLAKKLAKELSKTYWKHAGIKAGDIYDSVRNTIAYSMGSRVRPYVNGDDIAKNSMQHGFQTYIIV